MNKIYFILGGQRSGKSEYAINLAKNISNNEVTFIATASSLDSEMKLRIKRHKLNRPNLWKTIEENYNLESVIKNITSTKTIIIDCITVWISNILLLKFKDGFSTIEKYVEAEKEILKKCKNLMNTIKNTDYTLIIISNEVGMGIIPATTLGRYFADIQGKVNKIIASYADEVILLVAGIPIHLKKT